MEFQVLGPLRVVDGDTSRPLGGPKARSLLALLIAAAGTPVSMDALLMGMYGPDANPDQQRSVRTYISSFRRLLGDVIHKQRGGYVLAVPSDKIDAARFEAAIDRAASMVDKAASEAMLREALDLWRGTPYADIKAHGLEAEILRLEELHLTAIGTRIDLELATGRHRRLVPELEALSVQHPTRERFRAQLMLALYRGGRQADALQVYRDTEEHLRELLGLEPSPEIRQLELDILQQSSALEYRPAQRLRPIPARYTSFIGRASEVAEVRDLILTHRLVTITGPGGIGKSSLATEVARSLGEQMAATFVPVEAERATGILHLVAASLGLQPSEDADLVGLIGTTIGDTPTLLVIDGCEHVIDAVPTVVDGLLRRCPQVRVLVTSREAMFVTGEHRFELNPLDTNRGTASDHLFAERAGLRVADLDAPTQKSVAAISAKLAGIPLALELAAARARTMSIEAIEDRLDRQIELLSSSRSVEDRHSSLVHALDWSYQLLDESQQQVFRRLAVFGNEVPTDGVEFLLDSHDARVRLEELADVSLIARGQEHYTLLEPIRQYGWMLMEAEDELGATRRRYAEWTVKRCQQLWDSYMVDGDPAALHFLRSEGPRIELTAMWAMAHDMPEVVLGIVATVGRIWTRVLDGKKLREAAWSALRTHNDDDDLVAVASAHLAMMLREHDRRRTRELYEQAQARLPAVDDPRSRYSTLSALAACHHDLAIEPLDRQLALLDQAESLAGAAGYPREATLRNRTLMHLQLGQRREARASAQSYLALAGDSNILDRGHALNMMAILSRIDGDLERGLAHAKEATRLFIEGGDLDSAAETEFERARMLVFLGRSHDAEDALDAVDRLHGLIGLPVASVDDPALAARVAGDQREWAAFEEAMSNWVRGVSDSRALWIEGQEDVVSHVVLLLPPTMHWLAAHERNDEATRFAQAAEMALAATAHTDWEALGEAQRVRVAAAEFTTDQPRTDEPQTLDEVADAMTALFGDD